MLVFSDPNRDVRVQAPSDAAQARGWTVTDTWSVAGAGGERR